MSIKQSKLSSLLILEHFGESPRKIHDELLWGPRTLKLIISNTGIPITNVKKILSLFIQYGFVTFDSNKVGIAEYILQPQKILLLLRYPRYLSLINEKYGDASRHLIEVVLKFGRITATKTILQAWNKLKVGNAAKFNTKVAGLRDSFNELVTKQYLMKCPAPENDVDRVPVLTVKDEDLHKPVVLDIQKLIQLEKGEIKEDATVNDKDLWRCNFDRFHQDMRDEIMINAITRRFDSHAGKFMEVLLKLIYIRTDPWATQSNPVPLAEVRDRLEKEKCNPYLIQYLEQYIKVIEDDSCQFIRRISEGSSGSVYVNFVSAFRSLASSTIDSIIEHRFGDKAARIFRLIRSKIYIDQEQLQKTVMIPDKEAKQLTYRLLQESFLQLHELKKAATTGGPVKNFHLFHIKINQVCQVVLDMCSITVSNTLSRATHEKNVNMRLIEKYEKLTLLTQSLREQGNDEAYIKQVMDELMSPPEKSLLDSVEGMIQKLRFSELNLDETMFILNLYTYYDSCENQEKK
ncbi:DNA-directed RNA polymerase III subunit RPC3 [Halyomorpha halys]|uniref:DNA-directed RNA polymerase III subunit RPC3 n=1 Tax=Halyomorpha halys TaxID=286706 RepID=UPI0006D4D3A3|nr:DNA-directed RNA polymerase III subunit RPC3 [Halyomorpha halys]